MITSDAWWQANRPRLAEYAWRPGDDDPDAILLAYRLDYAHAVAEAVRRHHLPVT